MTDIIINGCYEQNKKVCVTANTYNIKKSLFTNK